jgi:hypothetical protein
MPQEGGKRGKGAPTTPATTTWEASHNNDQGRTSRFSWVFTHESNARTCVGHDVKDVWECNTEARRRGGSAANPGRDDDQGRTSRFSWGSLRSRMRSLALAPTSMTLVATPEMMIEMPIDHRRVDEARACFRARAASSMQSRRRISGARNPGALNDSHLVMCRMRREAGEPKKSDYDVRVLCSEQV